MALYTFGKLVAGGLLLSTLAFTPALAQDATFMLVDATLSGFIAAMMVARTIGILPAGFFGGQRQYG